MAIVSSHTPDDGAASPRKKASARSASPADQPPVDVSGNVPGNVSGNVSGDAVVQPLLSLVKGGSVQPEDLQAEAAAPAPVQSPEVTAPEDSLRPQRLQDYIGQASLKEVLDIAIKAAQSRQEPLDHLLLYGPPGLGKTTMALILAQEMLRPWSAPATLPGCW